MIRCSSTAPHNEQCFKEADEQCTKCLHVFCYSCIQQHACNFENLKVLEELLQAIRHYVGEPHTNGAVMKRHLNEILLRLS